MVHIEYSASEEKKKENSASVLASAAHILKLEENSASREFLVVQTVKCLSTMWETWAQSLGWEDPLEKKMATHPSTISWKIPWTEEPGRLQSMGSQRVKHD